MSRVVLLAAICLGLALAAPAWAGFDEGMAAYKRGDYKAAVDAFRPLAEEGERKAQFALGTMYHEGRGAARDDVLAYMWFHIAVAQNHKGAIRLRDLTAKELTPAELAEAQRLARDWRPKK